MCMGFVTDSKSEYDKFISDGYNGIICTNRTKISDDLYAVTKKANLLLGYKSL